jgi:DNA-binding response OmpR family regulator
MPSSCAKIVERGSVTVAIVDSRPSDYSTLPDALDRLDIHWRFVAGGRQALRLAEREWVDLWVINAVLADMPGTDLCRMLNDRFPRPVIYMVTDAYRVEDERAARCCGIALFACKPVQASWFEFDSRVTDAFCH